MSDPDCSFRSDSPSGTGGPPHGVPEVIVRVQRLIDSPRPVGGYSMAWHVEALGAGDLTAIAVAALRGIGARSAPSAR